LPLVYAAPTKAPFPNLPFHIFSDMIQNTFHPDISLATVLILLFTLTENTDLLNLHARQQHPHFEGEKRASGWLLMLARILCAKFDEPTQNTLFTPAQQHLVLSDQQKHKTIAEKLVNFTDSLSLNPYNENGHFSALLQPVSHYSIQPIHVITPNTSTCITPSCQPRALLVGSRWRDVPKVTLIKGKSLLYTSDNLLSNIFKGTTLFDDAYVVPGKCPKCLHIYYADHDHIPGQIPMRTFLNSAKYLKVGQSVWVDRVFSNAVLAGMYHFHASATAYTAFWNSSFWEDQKNIANPITRRHIWQTFTQESIRSIAALSQFNVSLCDHLSISDLACEAFNILGENGIIRAANQHACSECIQPYKRRPDFITGEFVIYNSTYD